MSRLIIITYKFKKVLVSQTVDHVGAVQRTKCEQIDPSCRSGTPHMCFAVDLL